MSITIRRATTEDARAIAEVKIIGWETTYVPIAGPELVEPLLDLDSQETYQREVIERPDGLTLLAEGDAGRVVGIAVSFMHGEPHLESLHVLPNFRSQRVGEQLVRALATALLEQGHSALTLDVLEANTRAQAFYQRLDAKYVGTDPVAWANNTINGHRLRWDNLSALANQPQ